MNDAANDNEIRVLECDIRTKRVYAPAEDTDGKRVLVDRIWPRGVSKDTARLDAWMKDVAPSAELRRWFHASRDRWDAFKTRYAAELDARGEAMATLAEMARGDTVTLLFSSTDEERNNAVVLKQYLLAKVNAR